MIRPGRVTGASMQYRVTKAHALSDSIILTIRKNAVDTSMTVEQLTTISVDVNGGAITTSNSFAFAAGDTIMCRMVLDNASGPAASVLAIEETAILIEIIT